MNKVFEEIIVQNSLKLKKNVILEITNSQRNQQVWRIKNHT